MSARGQHASRLRFFPRRTQAPAPAPPPVATDQVAGLPRRTAGREAVAAGLRTRQALTAQRDIPAALLPALRAWTPSPAVPQEYASEPVMPYWNPGQRTVAVDLAGTGAETPRPRSAFVADWRDLKHFRATCKTAGWCGLAMRKGGAQ